jgi:hypothetical protein
VGDRPLQYRRLSVVVDHDKSRTATAVEPWWALHPRVTRRFLPTYCPRANPIERAFGDGHDLYPHTHRCKRRRALVTDGVEPLRLNGPWKDHLSHLYDAPALTVAVEKMGQEKP